MFGRQGTNEEGNLEKELNRIEEKQSESSRPTIPLNTETIQEKKRLGDISNNTLGSALKKMRNGLLFAQAIWLNEDEEMMKEIMYKDETAYD